MAVVIDNVMETRDEIFIDISVGASCITHTVVNRTSDLQLKNLLWICLSHCSYAV